MTVRAVRHEDEDAVAVALAGHHRQQQSDRRGQQEERRLRNISRDAARHADMLWL